MKRRNIVAVSGGRDSAALAIYLSQRMDDLELVFADTGRELPEVYTFLGRLETSLGATISRISDGWACSSCGCCGTEVNVRACPKCGSHAHPRDFDYYIKRWANDEVGPFLPSPSFRWCTKHLKLRPFDRFVGRDSATVFIGIRSDEWDRKGNYGDRPNVSYRYPFLEDDIDLDGVKRIISEAHLVLPEYYAWRTTGGCWCCPFQRASDWAGLKEHHPTLFQRAAEEEKASMFTWKRGTTLKSMVEVVEKQGVLFDDGPASASEYPCLICAK